jgi:hypothetical protein
MKDPKTHEVVRTRTHPCIHLSNRDNGYGTVIQDGALDGDKFPRINVFTLLSNAFRISRSSVGAL